MTEEPEVVLPPEPETILDLFKPETRKVDECFDCFTGEPESAVTEIFPKIFADNRGWFAEETKGNHSFIKQSNMSCSKPGTVRGFHAQKGKFCQGKLVSAVNQKLFDVIADARPASVTFGTIKAYLLDPDRQNKLWVPRGFLHCFVVPTDAQSMAYFSYLCDNVYDKDSEIGMNPRTILQQLTDYSDMLPDGFASLCRDPNLIYSEKDLSGLDYGSWMAEIQSAGKEWYR